MTLKKVQPKTTTRIRKQKQEPKNNGPWVEITAAGQGGDDVLRIELDWNEEFIAHLRSYGYKGITEQEIVGRWVKDLHNQLLSEVEQGPGPKSEFV